MTTETFARLALALIEPSLTNPRKTFDAAKLQELADSIKASGVHQPVLVRPLPGSRLEDTHLDPASGKKRTVLPTHELVAGERRYRASKLAGVADIPAMIRELTDDQVLEIQMVENLQRDDLSELEEAEGFRMMMDRLCINAEAVGAKIGKSRAYVYTRTKLLDLSVETKQALREGKIDASRALLIARIPDSKLQLKALEYATKAKGYLVEPPSVREFQGWLRDNVMLKLENAVFKITDSRLVTEAGSCSDCPKRTGANPDLFVEVDSADICTDPACFHSKEEAHRNQLRKRAEAKGMRVVEGKEALELMEGRHYRNLPEGYEDLSTKRPDLGQAGDTVQTLGELLGKEAPETILFVHPRTQEMVELVPTEKAQAVLLAKGLKSEIDDNKKDNENHEAVLERLQKQAAENTARQVHKAKYEATVSRVRGLDDKAALKLLISGDLLRAILLTKLGGYMDADDLAHALGYTFVEGEDEEDGVAMHIRATSTANLCKAVVLCELGEDRHYSSHSEALILQTMVGVLELDTTAITKQASAAVKAEFADRLKDVKAKIEAKNAQKAPAATAPLAQPEHAGGDKPKGAKAPAKKAPAARAKLSAQEAISGIAAAMQSVDRAAAAPGGAVAPPGATKAETQGQLAGLGFALGQVVQVTSDSSKFGKRLSMHKWCGKKGTITGRVGEAWDVTFKGRSGGVASFDEDEISLVEGAAA